MTTETSILTVMVIAVITVMLSLIVGFTADYMRWPTAATVAMVAALVAITAMLLTAFMLPWAVL